MQHGCYYRPLEEIKEKIFDKATEGFKNAYEIHEKQARESAIDKVKSDIKEEFLPLYPEYELDFNEILNKALKTLVRDII